MIPPIRPAILRGCRFLKLPRTAMNNRYDAADIEVLSGPGHVERRPGMDTDSSRPNPPVQEVIDNASLAG